MPGPLGVPVPYRFPPKHQHDITPRSMAFADWLATVPGDTIASVSATISPAVYGGVAVLSVVISGSSVTVWLNGGVEGQDYVVILTVVATSGRTEDFPVQLSVPAVATIV